MTLWHPLAGSQIGSAHVRAGTDAQDVGGTWTGPDGSAVIAVADGHGHAAHFRSVVGADVAVSSALDVLSGGVGAFDDAGEAQRVLAGELGPELVRRWRAGVLDHAQSHPFNAAEQSLMSGSGELDILQSYGSTVIAMAGSERVLAVVQLGDGDAVVAAASGRVWRPLPPDADLDGVRTTSLCQPDPLRSLRTAALDVAAEDLALGFVCTDGFGTPRVDADGWWSQVAAQLLQLAAEHDTQWMAAKLPSWLEEPAEVGGDDTTLAILLRVADHPPPMTAT